MRANHDQLGGRAPIGTGAIVGVKLGARSRRPKTEDPGRRCSDPDCDTILSIYNRREFCSPHRPIAFPPSRGRRRDLAS